jgi:RimJ/RimL family protein N-acetyltransferase
MQLPAEPVRLTGNDLVLREWDNTDLPVMVDLFDEVRIAERTPLRSPFDLEAARAYLDAARNTRAEGSRLHLAITTDGRQPLGEVLVSIDRASLGYAVGARHRGQGLASRAAGLLTAYAHQVLELPCLRLEIEADNAPSVAVARSLGFRLTDEEPKTVTEKGRTYLLHTWAHHAVRAPATAD